MIYIADALGRTDGSAHQLVSRIDTDVPILLVSRVDGFVFNEQINSLAGKKYILCDYIEYGWDFDWKVTHVWGVATDKIDFLNTPEYLKLDDFICKNPPAITFKRELHTKDANDTTFPIEYPNWNLTPLPQSKEQFESRQLSVCNFWGKSHELRVQTHGDIWKYSSTKGYNVCDNIYYYNNFIQQEQGEKWATFHIAHYSRIDIQNLFPIFQNSKITLSLHGAGIKCFRSTGEAPLLSAMALPYDNLAWGIPWMHKQNCFRIWNEDIIGGLLEALKYPGLYDIYVNGVETAKQYEVNNYISNYLLPKINKA